MPMLQPRVTSVARLPDFTLKVSFDNGVSGIVDVRPYIRGSWYGRLADPAYFRTVHTSDGGIQWADGQDIAPHELYDCALNH